MPRPAKTTTSKFPVLGHGQATHILLYITLTGCDSILAKLHSHLCRDVVYAPRTEIWNRHGRLAGMCRSHLTLERWWRNGGATTKRLVGLRGVCIIGGNVASIRRCGLLRLLWGMWGRRARVSHVATRLSSRLIRGRSNHWSPWWLRNLVRWVGGNWMMQLWRARRCRWTLSRQRISASYSANVVHHQYRHIVGS